MNIMFIVGLTSRRLKRVDLYCMSKKSCKVLLLGNTVITAKISPQNTDSFHFNPDPRIRPRVKKSTNFF